MTTSSSRKSRILRNLPIVRTLASLKLAVVTMGSLAAILAVGTLIESRYNADMARLLVYDRWWFDLLLAFLFLNILFSVLIRMPLKRHQYAFGCIHLGMLVLLAGAFGTRLGGLDGTIEIPEGSASMAVRLPETVLRSYLDERFESEVPLDRSLVSDSGDLGPVPGFPGNGPRIVQSIPFSKIYQKTSPTPDGTPIVELALMAGESEPIALRLALDHPALPSRQDAASLHVSLEPVGSVAAFLDTTPNIPAALSLECRHGKNSVEFALGELVPGRTKNDGMLEVGVVEFLPDARIGDSGLANQSGNLVNPAVRLKVSTGTATWEEILYGRVPGFRFTGDAHPEVSWKIEYRPHGGAAQAPTLRLGAAGDSLLARCERDGRILAAFHVVPGRSMRLPLEGVHASVGTWLPRADLRDSCVEVDPAPGAALPPPAIRVGQGPWGAPRWIPLGGFFGWSEAGHRRILSHEERRTALPFGIRLDSFKVGTNPGTMDAASYESFVTVVDSLGAPLDTARIAMNEPLQHGGYTFYQASFVQRPGAPSTTILSVNRDPGRPFKYLGSLLAVISIGWYAAERLRKRTETPA